MLVDEDVDGHDRLVSPAASEGKDQTFLKRPLTQKSIYSLWKSEKGQFARRKSQKGKSWKGPLEII